MSQNIWISFTDIGKRIFHVLLDYYCLFCVDCYCKTPNGELQKNGFMCKVNNTFEHSGFCKPDEWCTGPTDSRKGTGDIYLCSKGDNGIRKIRPTFGQIL